MHKYCQVWLTCSDKSEADKISRVLIEKQLVACAKQIPVVSDFIWRGKVESNSEIMLIMESYEGHFSRIEKEVSKIHSYETFVLYSTSMSSISSKAKKWLKSEIRNEH